MISNLIWNKKLFKRSSLLLKMIKKLISLQWKLLTLIIQRNKHNLRLIVKPHYQQTKDLLSKSLMIRLIMLMNMEWQRGCKRIQDLFRLLIDYQTWLTRIWSYVSSRAFNPKKIQYLTEMNTHLTHKES